MHQQKKFKHLALILKKKGAATIPPGGKESQQTKNNKENRIDHSQVLGKAAQNIASNWKATFEKRSQEHLPPVPKGIPILLQIDPNLDVDEIRHHLGFEIISEQEDGYIIVGTEDLDLKSLLDKINAFGQSVYGSTKVASVHKFFDDPTQAERLRRILSEYLFELLPKLKDDQLYVVDVSIACTDSQQIPTPPKRGKRDTDMSWEEKQLKWNESRSNVVEAWDDLKMERENELRDFIRHYSGKILKIEDSIVDSLVVLPDSFTVRLQINGAGLRDFVLNFYPIFEVIEPENMEQSPHTPSELGEEARPKILPPSENAPAVCVIDSGIQEGHYLLEPAIDTQTHRCFIPHKKSDDVKDEVSPSGHGTRVAGAILYRDNIPASGKIELPFWIQNARVLDEDNGMPHTMLPPLVIWEVVRHFHWGAKQTRIFNQSINTRFPCRTHHMSAWGAAIDYLCHKHDILFIQSVGNIPATQQPPSIGIKEHLADGRDYPDYLSEDISRVANPGQSLQALTVGSVAYRAFNGTEWNSIAQTPGAPSAFSRSGFGIWNTVKPDVVEFGGDYLRTHGNSPDISTNPIGEACYPPLVRSSYHSVGLATTRDEVGTSFAAPKVAHIAAWLQQILPNEPCLLYRALIVQSARWPEWAMSLSANEQVDVLRRIGYGIPDVERATTNTDHRTTFITSGLTKIKTGEGHVYQVSIPASMRRQSDEYDILVEVTLSYSAEPRRTRRLAKRYLSNWVSWTSSKYGEDVDAFLDRALKEQENPVGDKGTPFQWMFHENQKWGGVKGVKRNPGTVQKDWAIIKPHQLPEKFCIAVIGHKGWSHDPDTTANYTLAVSFEILGKEIPIYESLENENRIEIEVDEVETHF